MSSRCSRYTCLTVYPPMFIPRISPATVRASSSVFAGRMPPALPRPPTSTWAFTMHARGDLCGGAGNERLVRGPDVVEREELLLRLEAELRGDLKDGLPRDSGKVRRCERRHEGVVADNEDVLGARLGNIAVDVEHERFIRAVLVRLDLGHDVVQIIQGLDRRAEALGRDASVRRRDDLEAALVDLAEEIDARLRDHDDARTGLALPRIEAEIARPACDDRADVSFPDVVASARLQDDPCELLFRMRELQVDRFRTLEESVQVALELEDAAVVRADAFEDPVTVQQAMVEDADLRLGLR